MFLTAKETASFSIALQSTVETAQICYAQARKDALKVWAVVSHPEAIKTYRMVWNALVIACHVAVLLGMLARDGWEWFKRWSDVYVESCLEEEVTDETQGSKGVPLSAVQVPKPVQGHDVSLVKTARKTRNKSATKRVVGFGRV